MCASTNHHRAGEPVWRPTAMHSHLQMQDAMAAVAALVPVSSVSRPTSAAPSAAPTTLPSTRNGGAGGAGDLRPSTAPASGGGSGGGGEWGSRGGLAGVQQLWIKGGYPTWTQSGTAGEWGG